MGAERERGVLPSASELQIAKARQELRAEFRTIHAAETIDRVFAESLGAFASAGVPHHVPTLAQRIVRDRLNALGQTEGSIPRERPLVVFVELEGRGRSQMAAAFMSVRSQGRIDSVAAATNATIALDTNVVAAMAEIGIDLSEGYAKPVNAEVLAAADVVVTLGRSVGAVEIPASARHED